MSEQNEPSTHNLLNENERKDYQTSTPAKKPGVLASTLGKIALVGSAIGVGVSGTRGVTENPIQPIKDVASISREIKDFVSPKQEEQNITPAPIVEPQGAVNEEAVSRKPDLTELNKIFDTFVNDLRMIPAARMMGMEGTGVEGYKVAIGEETIKFIRKPDQTSHELDEITVEINSDDETKTYTIQGKEIEYAHRYNNPEHAEQLPPPTNKSTGELLTDELNSLYEQWQIQRAKNGELITTSNSAKPPEQTTPNQTPTPTYTPEPTPTPTESPTPFVPGPLNRDIQEASLQPTNPNASINPEEASIQTPSNAQVEVQIAQPIAADSTIPKSDL